MTGVAAARGASIRALIVDDEPLARRGLRQLVARHPDVAITGEARHGNEALALLAAQPFELVLLDVQMPEADGFAVIRAHGVARMPLVIFVTAFDGYAVRAFDAHAIDYLVKPIDEQRFDAALARARRQLALHAADQRLAALLAEPDPFARRLVVPSTAGDAVLDAGEIDWIGAEDYYAAVYAGGRQLLLREPLASLEARLDPAQFVRIHRNALINLARVRELTASDVVLRDGTRLPVSRRRRAQIVQAIRSLQATDRPLRGAGPRASRDA